MLYTWIGCKLLGLEGSGLVTTVISCWPLVDWVWATLAPPLELEVVTTTTLGLGSTPTVVELPPLPLAPVDAVRVYWAPVVVMAIDARLPSAPTVSPPPQPPCFWRDESTTSHTHHAPF